MPPNNTQKPGERDFFCRIRDIFRHFARKSSAVLGTAWGVYQRTHNYRCRWGLTGPVFRFSDTLAVNHQYRHYYRDVFDGVPHSEHPEPRRQGDAFEAG